MSTDKITLRGVRTHNLKNITLEIPRDKLIVFTGLSGSGKSSLVFDTLYAEGQRRYVESLSAYARQFLDKLDKPDCDSIEGLSPAIAIEQKTVSHNPRSTVGTMTEIYDYLRLLYSRVGVPVCPTHKIPLNISTIKEITENILKLSRENTWLIVAPVLQEQKGEQTHIIQALIQKGYSKAIIDGVMTNLDEVKSLEKNKKHSIDLVIDRFKIKDGLETRLSDSLENGFKEGNGVVVVANFEDLGEKFLYSNKHTCPVCHYSVGILEHRFFSFNNPLGACQTCNGLGIKEDFSEDLIIPNKELSLEEGAIKGWPKGNGFYYQNLVSVANHHHIDLTKPFKKLSSKEHNIIMNGSNEELHFIYENERGSKFERYGVFEGVLNNFRRRYKETSSDSMRQELSKMMKNEICPSCHGQRLNEKVRNVFINEKNISDVGKMSISQTLEFVENIKLSSGNATDIALPIVKEIVSRLTFLTNVGLSYLSLSQTAGTLSGGEAQRIRLASQIGSALMGVMYVLDEPSIGLHQRDNEKLIETLKHLRDVGNSVIVIEHDSDTMLSADHLVEIGPMAGEFGGEVVFNGSLKDFSKANTLTSQYLFGKKEITNKNPLAIPKNHPHIHLEGACGNNLKNVNLSVPLGRLVCITGVSGSGKSTLINETFYPALHNHLLTGNMEPVDGLPYENISGLEHINKVINIDQSPIGRTPRSNPATYVDIFKYVRDIYADTEFSKAQGWSAGRFSFNVEGGRCENCVGDGVIKVEMHFMSDIYVICEKCDGKRYNDETLKVRYKGKTIYDILKMSVAEALTFFQNISSIRVRLQALMDVGLSYITLGHSATTLSGGEAQRIKLARELARKDTGKTLYILDEPTTGLHFYDTQNLLDILFKLRDGGNSIVVVEHNLDVIKVADWVIDLGPEGGAGGGEILVAGDVKTIAKSAKSHTGRFLKKILG